MSFSYHIKIIEIQEFIDTKPRMGSLIQRVQTARLGIAILYLKIAFLYVTNKLKNYCTDFKNPYTIRKLQYHCVT